MEDQNMNDGDNQNYDTEVTPALISLHPAHHSVAVAVGSDLRVFNLSNTSPVTLPDDSGHKDSIRAIRYGENGKLFVSAGDDKLVKIWDADSWRCMFNVSSEKRVSAVAVSSDGQFVCFADKFGVVYVADTKTDSEETSAVINKKGVPILSHYCSIITSLEFSPDGKYIISADRDSKIRVTVFPQNPFDGAHEIQSFCLGHTEFVSCLAFFCNPDCPQGLLVSGGGDSTVRLWDFTCGSLLDTCDVGEKADIQRSEGKEEESPTPITDLCVTQDGSLIAVAIQSLTGILLLSCNLSTKTLSVVKVISISDEAYVPTSIGSAQTAEFLWMVMGVSNLNDSNVKSLVRVRALSCKSNSESLEPLVLEDKDTPGGELMLEKLQGSLSIEKEAFSTAAEAVKASMRNLLIKKQYSVERRDFRKRGRNDKKMKQK